MHFDKDKSIFFPTRHFTDQQFLQVRFSNGKKKATPAVIFASHRDKFFCSYPPVKDLLTGNGAEILIIWCCDVFAFLGSTRDGSFSMGSTRVYLKIDLSHENIP